MFFFDYKKIKRYLFITLLLVVFFNFLLTTAALASGVTFMGNPLAGDKPKSIGAETLVGRITKAAIAIVGSLTLVMVVYGGVMWLLASGNEEKVGKAKKILVWSLLGLIVVFSAYAILSFALSQITATTIPQ
jgi:hypothetical protein